MWGTTLVCRVRLGVQGEVQVLGEVPVSANRLRDVVRDPAANRWLHDADAVEHKVPHSTVEVVDVHDLARGRTDGVAISPRFVEATPVADRKSGVKGKSVAVV